MTEALSILHTFISSHSEVIFTLLGIFLGFIGQTVTAWLSDKRVRERDQAARLFNERKDVYSELIFQLRELFLSSQGFERQDMTKHKINGLVHKVTFLTSSWSLRHRLPIISALVEMKELSKGEKHTPTQNTLTELGESLPKDIKQMEEEMRKELGIIEK